MTMINFLATKGIICAGIRLEGDIVGIIRTVYNGIKIGVPLILIFVGMFGMAKAITMQKEDEIKKAQNLLVRQAVAAVIVFLMFQLVQLAMSVIKVKNSSNWSCVKAVLVEPDSKTKCYTDDGKEAYWGSDHLTDSYWQCDGAAG